MSRSGRSSGWCAASVATPNPEEGHADEDELAADAAMHSRLTAGAW
jgi:hypothetical protein